MKAGALRTILADVVWTPRRAHKRENNCNGDCLLCGEKNAGDNHLWWECRALNNHDDFGYFKLIQIRNKENNQPSSFWNTGLVTTYWTTLPESEHMKAEDLRHECK
eukprot:5686642-Heterocapsa_arctica.AAC.1